MDTTVSAHGGLRRLSRVVGGLVVASALLLSSTAEAGDREALKVAFNKALGQYNNLELDEALKGIDEAIKAGRDEDPNDPALAPLLVLRAGIIYSNTGDADQTKAALKEAVEVDYHVQVPIELRAEQFQGFLDEVRSGASAPSESVRHDPPTATCGGDIEFSFLVSGMVDGGQVAFYWRKGSSGEFESVSMDTFGNLATVTVPASDHGDASIEYFVYVFDGDNKEQANKGDQDNPMVLSFSCGGDEPEPEPEPPPKPKTTLGKFFVTLNFGTGAGIARGVADMSYRQYSPRYRDQSTGEQFVYGSREYACAIARWAYPQDELPGDAITFQNKLTEIQALSGQLPEGLSFFGPGMTPQSIALAYDSNYCSEHHPVQTGMASAPFHIAPEFGFRIGDKIVVSVFSRLQLVTGSKVYRDDPKEAYPASFANNVYDVIHANPDGVRVKPPFAWSVGVKGKYYLGKDDSKFRLFVGGFGGYGTARLRVNMNFANDRNGNSIPDDREFAYDLVNEDAPFDATTNPCTPVWPYNSGCVPGDGTDPINNLGDRDRAQATYKAQNADKDPRIDTVGIGRGMLGATVGFHYQIVKNFGVSSELQIGGWLGGKKAPTTSSLLFDLNVGPVISF